MIRVIKDRYAKIMQWAYCFCARTDDVFCKKDSVIYWCAALLYKFALDMMYVWAAHIQYAYGGLILSTNSVKYILSFVMYVCLLACLPRKEKSAVNILLHLQFIMTVAPMLTAYALMDQSTIYMVGVVVCIAVQAIIVGKAPEGRKMVCITGVKNYTTVIMGVLAIFAVVVPIIYNGMFNLDAIDLDKVYDIRSSVMYPPGYVYIQQWTAKVILPFALIMFLEKKKYIFAGVTAILQIVLFLPSGHKVIMLLLFVVLGVYVLSKTGHAIKFLYIGFTALSLVVVLCYQLDRLNYYTLGNVLTALVPVRFLFGPADNKFRYYEFFNEYPKLFFSDSRIGDMLGLSYPYNATTGYMIYAYSGGEFMVSNSITGYLGEAYAQIGFLGIFLMALLLAWILRGIKRYENCNNCSIVASLFAVQIVQLIDAPMFTVLLTCGMLLAYLLVIIYFGKCTKGDCNGIQRV